MVHYRKILIVLIFVPIIITCQNFPDGKVDSLLKAGINEILHQDYNSSKMIFSELDSRFPNLPLGKIYLAAVYIAESEDYAIAIMEETVDSLLEAAENQADSLLEINESNKWYNYYMALTDGYYAYYQALRDNYLSAVTNGLSSISYFENCLEADSSFHESYIAIGTYLYWKSVKLEPVLWLPFFSDERVLGQKYLEQSVDYDTYNKYLAINSLIWIYIDQEKFRKAIDIGEKYLKVYPQFRFFKLGLARAYEEIDNDKAAYLYRQILESYSGTTGDNYFNSVVLKHKIAMQLEAAGRIPEALAICEEVLSIKDMNEKQIIVLQDRLDRVKELKNRLQQLNPGGK